MLDGRELLGSVGGLGKVVDLAQRESGRRRCEAGLDRIGSYFRDQCRAREALPGVLAALVRAGQEQLVLTAIIAWGEYGMDPVQILADCRRMLAD